MKADTAAELRIQLPAAADMVDEAIAEIILLARFRGALVIGQVVLITVLQGQVILSGSVGSEPERAAAEHTLQGLPGVVGVTNLVTICTEECISSGTGALFRRDSMASQTEVWIRAVDGRVSLRGMVGSAREHDLVTRVARAVPGVVYIDNQIALSEAKMPC
jgi:osmotically-inducible protein OsmY